MKVLLIGVGCGVAAYQCYLGMLRNGHSDAQAIVSATILSLALGAGVRIVEMLIGRAM